MMDSSRLARLLRDEIRLQTQHCKLLEAQQRALLACDRPRFCALQEEYALLLIDLEAQTKARQEEMQDEQGASVTLSALLETWPEREQSRIAPLRDTLKRTLGRAQELCRCNRQMIQNELTYLAFSLDLFVEAGRRADLKYGGGRWGGRKLLDRRA